MKYIVQATQIITQDAEFIVDVPEEFDGETIHDETTFAKQAVENQPRMLRNDTGQFVSLFDARDERYLENIVTNVRLATEEESK